MEFPSGIFENIIQSTPMARMTSLRNSWLVGQRDSGKDHGSLQGAGGGGGGEAYDAREEGDNGQRWHEREGETYERYKEAMRKRKREDDSGHDEARRAKWYRDISM